MPLHPGQGDVVDVGVERVDDVVARHVDALTHEDDSVEPAEHASTVTSPCYLSQMWVWVLLAVCTPICIVIGVIAGRDLRRQYDAEIDALFDFPEGEE